MIEYKIGDATNPEETGKICICHICNDSRVWGAGFVLALSRKWKEPEQVYRGSSNMDLGDIQLVDVEDNIKVCNMIAQHGIGMRNGPPIRYTAVEDALRRLQEVIEEQYTIVCPKMGSGLAGGKWEKIEEIIIKQLVDKGRKVVVYSLN